MVFKKKKNSRRGAEESLRTSEAPRSITTPSPIADPRPPTPRTLRPNRTVDIDINNETSMKYQLQAHDQKIKAADSACEAAQATIQELRTGWQDDRELGALFVERAHMRTSRFELAAREVDVEMWNKRAHAEDWEYIDQLVTMKNPPDPGKQERWRKNVIKAYDAKDDQEKIWCPISRQHLSSWMITTTHIVRSNVAEPAAVHLFGPSNNNSGGHIWSIKNGIPLCKEYEQMLDDARIAIMPTIDGSGLMVVILDEAECDKGLCNKGLEQCSIQLIILFGSKGSMPSKSSPECNLDLRLIFIDSRKAGASGIYPIPLLWLSQIQLAGVGTWLGPCDTEREEEWDPTDYFPTGKALHGRTLEFLTDHRPSIRYLYFAFVINILRRQRFEVDGWWRDRLEYADIIPAPGKWIRETTLRKLAVRMGHLPTDDASNFATTTCRGSQLEHKGKDKATDIATDEVEDDAFSDLLAHSLNMDRMIEPDD
ncbi:hypothetical protein F4803DRAFT_553017 [Xylaria telfairii]|nr:hypothetical protein F4803DRAFT_553017 [Xylaria telfairii]